MGLREKLMDVRKEEIVVVATKLFYVKGYVSTSMEDIARELNVGKPTIYSCFNSKADLLAEVCNYTTAMAASLAADALNSPGSPSDRLKFVVKELSLRVIDGRMNMSVLFREVKHLPEEARERLSKNFHAFNSSLRRLLREGVDSGDFHNVDEALVTQAVSGMATWIFTWYKPKGSFSPEYIADSMAEYALRIVCKR